MDHRRPEDPLRLKVVRQGREISASKAANELGVHWATIFRHERGEGTVPRHMVVRYANLYSCPMHELFMEPGVL